jgi:prolipoprotein diacylglyceryltransferase
VHPTQIYEVVLDIALFAALLLVGTRFLEGWELLLCSLAGYALIRFFMEFFRLHSNPRARLFFQLFSVAVFVACAGALGV